MRRGGRTFWDVRPVTRLVWAAAAGAVTGLALTWRSLPAGLLAGWAVAGAVYCGWTLAVTMPMDAAATATHATREEPTRVAAHAFVTLAAIASLGGVGVVLTHGAPLDVATALVAVVVSWASVHTSAALRYARLYYTPPVGGVDFHADEQPRYTDFAYMAFTVGMSFAISDTDLASSVFRRHALLHALLSYLFGTVIVALLVNLVAGLG